MIAKPTVMPAGILIVMLASAVSMGQTRANDTGIVGRSQSAQAPVVQPAKHAKIYRVGGDVKAPRVISSSEPELSEGEIKRQSQGKKVVTAGSAVVRIVVGEDGTVQSVKIIQKLSPELDAKAVDAVRQWKFQPATKKGIPVPVELEVEVDFHPY